MNNAAHPSMLPPDPPMLTGEDGDDSHGPFLRELIGLLIDGRYIILVTLLLALAGAWFRLWQQAPIYKATSLLQIEQRQSAGSNEQLAQMMGYQGAAPVAAELEIIHSRSVLEPAADALGYSVFAAPRYFPVVGQAFARHYAPDRPGQVRSVPGFARRYAWGGERIRIARLLTAPGVEALSLLVKARPDGGFEVFARGQSLGQGSVGAPFKPAVESAAIQELVVGELWAAPGTEFEVRRTPLVQAALALQSHLTVNEKTRGAGIVEISVTSPDAAKAAEEANRIAEAYVRQNLERRSQEAAQTLAFVEEQLPRLRQDVEGADLAMREYRTRTGGVELSEASKAFVDKLAAVDQEILSGEMQRTELLRRFTENHPAVQALSEKNGRLQQEKAQLESRIRGLPAKEVEALQRARSAKVADEMYLIFLNKAQELRIAKAGTVGNARIVDFALTPGTPVLPQPAAIWTVHTLLGLLTGLGLIYMRRQINQTIQVPEVVEKRTGVPIYATIPFSSAEQRLRGDAATADRQGRALRTERILSRAAPQDLAVESVRSLMTAMQFALFDSGNNRVTITGPTPGVGKSFVSLNLAWLLAEAGKNVLLIDADLRRGSLHEKMGVARSPGLSNLISGNAQLSDAVITDGRFSFLSAGTTPPNPVELLMTPQFTQLVEQASKQYDIVIIDTPPTLNLADPLLVGKISATNFLVVRGNVSSLDDVKISIKRLAQAGIRLNGVIYNDLRLGGRLYGYGHGGYYRYYRYNYKGYGKQPDKTEA